MKVTELSNDKVLELYEKSIKSHIEFMAAVSEVQKYLSKISSYEIEVRSGYEFRLNALEKIISERGLIIPEEWTKYPSAPNYRMMLRVLELEKVRRLSLVRCNEQSEYDLRLKELNREFEFLTDEVLLSALDDANILNSKMSDAELIVQRVLEKHGYFNRISIIAPYINRYWDASTVVKSRGYIIVDRPALNTLVDESDVLSALEDGLVSELAKSDDEDEKYIIKAIFGEAMSDKEEIMALIKKFNDKVKKVVSI